MGRPEDFAVERLKFFSYKDPLFGGSFFALNAVSIQMAKLMVHVEACPSKANPHRYLPQQLAA